jgi:hypothetical protein
VRVRSQFPTTEPIEKGNILVKASTEEEAFKKVINYRKSPKLYTEISHVRELTPQTPQTPLMKIFIIICLAVLTTRVYIFVVDSVENQNDKVISVAECINDKMDFENYQGDYRIGWELYAESCK